MILNPKVGWRKRMVLDGTDYTVWSREDYQHKEWWNVTKDSREPSTLGGYENLKELCRLKGINVDLVRGIC